MSSQSFLYNNQLHPEADFDQLFENLHPSVYEVIRVMEGKPLFLGEHYERLTHSLESIDEKNPLTCEVLGKQIQTLAKENGISNGNVRLVLNGFKKVDGPSIYLKFVPATYPSSEMYRDGVKTALFSAVRENPHAKIVNQSLRDQTDVAIREKGVFEVLLVNEDGCITEGSRSNVFFIKEGKVYTCPSHGVLLGVTRQRILRICAENDIPVIETPIVADQVSQYEAAFISGTSPKVLPIISIEGVAMHRDNPTLCRIMALYDQEIADYLKNFKA